MLLDSSALVCALMDEPEARRLAELLEGASTVAVGAPVVVEAGLILAGRGVDPRHLVHGFLDAIGADVLEFRKQHQSLAINAFLRFGKGRHPARLNFGDCLSYAYAALTGLALVYKGDDFGRTDLVNLCRLDTDPSGEGAA